MAKPGSPPTQWATDATFSSGPRAGDNTKAGMAAAAAQGFVPGDTAKSPTLNEVLNMITGWLDWLNDGSSAADADAHIVETDSSGKASLKQLDVDWDGSGFGVEVTGTQTGGGALLYLSHTGTASGANTIEAINGSANGGNAIKAQYQGADATGAVVYANAVTENVGCFAAECSNNATPGFAIVEAPDDAGDIRLAQRTANSTSTVGGDLWMANGVGTPNHDDPIRFHEVLYNDDLMFVHSSLVPHLLTGESRDSTDAILSRTISSYISMVDRQYYARGSDTIRVRAGLSISSNGSGVAEVRLVVNGVEVDHREWDGTQYWPTGTTGEEFDLVMCSDVSEAAVSASGLTTVALQWRETGSGTIYSARSYIEVYRGFNQD